MGDETTDAIFDALEARGSGVEWIARRLRIEHGDGVVRDLIPRAKQLGVVIVQNPSHFTWPEMMRARLGPHMQPLRSLLDAGIPVALGSDGPLNPFLNLMFATLHPYAPTQAITREEAVRAYTHGSAFAEFAEHDKRSLGAGKLADLTVLSQHIFTVAPQEVPQTHSVLTIVGGEIVHEVTFAPKIGP